MRNVTQEHAHSVWAPLIREKRLEVGMRCHSGAIAMVLQAGDLSRKLLRC